MILAFVDECGDGKFKDYFGLSCAVMSSVFYKTIKTGVTQILKDGGWLPEFEFKGNTLFSEKSGDPNVPVEKRMEMVSQLLDLSVATKNARIRFVFAEMKSTSTREYYLRHVPILLAKALPRASKSGDKDVVSLHFDRLDGIKPGDILEAVTPTVERMKYTLLEDIVIARSSHRTVGIMYADIVGYLAARVSVIAQDRDLFASVPAGEWEKNGKLRKWKSSALLLDKIKKLDLYEVKTKL